LTADEWEARARSDRKSTSLYDLEGTLRTYDQLLATAGGRYDSLANPSLWDAQATRAQECLDELASHLAEAKPDVVLIVGDDQLELFTFANLPALSIYYGDAATSHPFELSEDPQEKWREAVADGYGMDRCRDFKVASAFARDLIERLVDQNFDVAASSAVPSPKDHGFGHAYGFVVTRLMRDLDVPIVPIMLNTYYPPNQPTPARCFALGEGIRQAIEATESGSRVAIVASGGLSHFVTNESLDISVLDALQSDDRSELAKLPPKLLNDGSSEIRNWITLGGALGPLTSKTVEYFPVYRTPAGTGIGLGFAAFGR
jgi:hypothetical protein